MLKFLGHSPARIQKFFSYYKPYRSLLIADLACALVVSAVAAALPLCARIITNDILGADLPDSTGRIAMVGGLMLALVALHTACNTFVDYRGHVMGSLMEGDMRAELFAHYQNLSFSFYDDRRVGQLMTLITSDLFSLSELYHHGPEDLAIAFLKACGVLLLLSSIHPGLTLVIFLFLPVMAVFAFISNRRMNAALRQTRRSVGDINAQVEDTLAGIRVVKSFTNEAIETRKFAQENRRFLDSRADGYRGEAVFSNGMVALSQLITVTVIVLGGVAITRAAITLADLLTFLMGVAILTEPVERLVNFGRLIQEGTTAFDRFMDMLEIAPEIADAPGAVEIGTARGEIEFQSVGFRYRADYADVLRDISLTIRAGETVALVGSSGAGKTTICSLISRFYETSAGRILLDGMDIRDIALRSLRGNIGIVQQDVYLFAGTVAENIGYGKPGASRAEIVEAARHANAHDFIMALPDGYDTDIGQRGVKLSGGQRQRLSIARVFLKNPPVLILDEATSALDNESERAIQESLERLAEDRTTLVIAHRLSTIRNADRILVLSGSGIEEQGTHRELLERGGTYANLYNMQFEVTPEGA